MHISVRAKVLGGLATGKNLTGSCIYLKISRGKDTTRGLVDCGLFQGNFKNTYETNLRFPYWLDASRLDFVILTHDHIDHIGRLPLLFKMGFRGRIFCTSPTNELLEIMLSDTAKILESEAEYLTKKANRENGENKANGGKDKPKREKSKSKPIKIDPLYTIEDVHNALTLVKNGGYSYGRWIKLIINGVQLKFYASGHVLGGAVCVIRIERDAGSKSYYHIGFSGDLGRKDGIILPPPDMPNESLDCLFTESTYGGEKHPSRDEEIFILKETINETIKNHGVILLPSFVLERAQEIIYLLSYLMQSKQIRPINIYLDSPMASKITEVFASYWHKGMFKDQFMLNFNAFSLDENPYLKIIESGEISAMLTKSREPHIVIAGAGMCDAGRIRNHLRARLGFSNTTICIVGYMAENSLGRKLSERMPIVKMNGQEIMVRSKIVNFGSFSAHADGDFLVEYANASINKTSSLSKIVIVHGDEINGLKHKRDLVNSLGAVWEDKVLIPEEGEEIEII